ncbi:cytochrome oxidase subunit III [Chitinophaga oryziterrae]|jgi:cytochrome c oxidase subunit 3|uniref:Cytochrome oxidase subunit III n=1 Tax=Chitinophaga oryziterrae TaxID=1031224 RepID=A0A6N8JDU1_9BACT|nr:cytochrome c oxidase subunit 3 [Chitinophaga oryziterrae]MVT42631.1 cytochrome oxidase subunit III [Chitinophaga oryziterrae]
MDTAVTAQKKWWSGGHSPFNVSYGKLMMWYFLMSDAFTFGALLISYGTIRFMSTSWPDPNEVFHSFPFVSHTAHLPLVFVSLMTFILIMSSVTMVLAVHAGHMRDRKAVAKWMVWTIIGGIAFLSCQAWEWTHLHELGAWWGRNPFANADGTVATTNFTNFFFTITGFHGLHVTSGVILNIVILSNVLKGTYDDRGHYEMVEKVGLYWHFVDLVWVFVFTCFYLL